MISLYADPGFTFRFAEGRRIDRVHLEGVPAGRVARAFAVDPSTARPGVLLTTGIVGAGGWVDLPRALIVRAGDAFVVYPTLDEETKP